jgi:hypothetical protein
MFMETPYGLDEKSWLGSGIGGEWEGLTKGTQFLSNFNSDGMDCQPSIPAAGTKNPAAPQVFGG